MLNTDYGQFDGDTWEKTCQKCFKLKYVSEQYQEIPASPGDYGIEGFTSTGKVFQCYCPDYDYTQTELYQKQRDKVSTDLKKLKTYSAKLQSKFGLSSIKEWIFITPAINRHDLIAHCEAKRVEVLSWGLSNIDPTFKVLAYDIDFLIPQINTVISSMGNKMSITPTTVAGEPEINKYKNSDGTLVENALRKHNARLEQNGVSNESNIQVLTQKTIRHFLDGSIILEKWKDYIQDDYEKFRGLVDRFEEEVIEICVFPTDDFNERLRSIKQDIASMISENFHGISTVMSKDLSNYVVADWILRCPIEFQNITDG